VREAVQAINPPGPDVLWRWVLKYYLRRLGKMEWLKGKKTYITAAAMFIIGGCRATGWLDPATADTILEMLAAVGLITLRAGVAK